MPSGRCTVTRSSPHRDFVTTNGKRVPRSGWNGWVIRICGASTAPGAFCSFEEGEGGVGCEVLEAEFPGRPAIPRRPRLPRAVAGVDSDGGRRAGARGQRTSGRWTASRGSVTRWCRRRRAGRSGSRRAGQGRRNGSERGAQAESLQCISARIVSVPLAGRPQPHDPAGRPNRGARARAEDRVRAAVHVPSRNCGPRCGWACSRSSSSTPWRGPSTTGQRRRISAREVAVAQSVRALANGRGALDPRPEQRLLYSFYGAPRRRVA